LEPPSLAAPPVPVEPPVPAAPELPVSPPVPTLPPVLKLPPVALLVGLPELVDVVPTVDPEALPPCPVPLGPSSLEALLHAQTKREVAVIPLQNIALRYLVAGRLSRDCSCMKTFSFDGKRLRANQGSMEAGRLPASMAVHAENLHRS